MDTIRAIIFDLDGVICFTDNYHYQAWKELADAEGIYFDEKINGRLRGVSRMESLDIILERASRSYTQEEKEQLATRKNESYVRLLEKMSPRDLSDEVKNTLDTLRQRGYKLAIGSSSKNTKKILKQIGFDGYFYAVSDGKQIRKCMDWICHIFMTRGISNPCTYESTGISRINSCKCIFYNNTIFRLFLNHFRRFYKNLRIRF